MSGQPAWPSTSMTLLARITRADDADAWSLFVGVYTPLIYKYCRKRGLQDADANEVTQNVMVQVSRVIGRFRYDPAKGKFRGWLGLLTRQAISHHFERNANGVHGAPDSLSEADLAGLSGAADPEWLDHFQTHIYH